MVDGTTILEADEAAAVARVDGGPALAGELLESPALLLVGYGGLGGEVADGGALGEVPLLVGGVSSGEGAAGFLGEVAEGLEVSGSAGLELAAALLVSGVASGAFGRGGGGRGR